MLFGGIGIEAIMHEDCMGCVLAFLKQISDVLVVANRLNVVCRGVEQVGSVRGRVTVHIVTEGVTLCFG